MGLGTDGHLPLIQALEFYVTIPYLLPLVWECVVCCEGEGSKEQGGYPLPGQPAPRVTQARKHILDKGTPLCY